MTLDVTVLVIIHVVLFWNVIPCTLVCEEGGCMYLRNVGTHVSDCTVSQFRSPQCTVHVAFVVSNRKIRAVSSSELSLIFYQIIWRHIPEGNYLLDAVTPCTFGRFFRRFGGKFFLNFQDCSV